jgi:SAM-dependent methyltransferase
MDLIPAVGAAAGKHAQPALSPGLVRLSPLSALRVVTSPPLTLAGWLRHDVVSEVLAGLEGVRSVLEVGAGEGAFGVRLAAAYDYTGLEPDERAFAIARRRLDALGRGTILNGSVELLDPDARFDLVCAFEVLEHQEDPVAALAQWRNRAGPGGRLLLSVPAGERLRASDLRVGHYRRYSAERIAAELDDAALEPLLRRHFGFPLGHGLELVRNVVAACQGPAPTREEGTGASGRWLQPAESLGWATRAASAPFRSLQRRWPTPALGTSILALARPKEASTAAGRADG